jgi:hypothetical protein
MELFKSRIDLSEVLADPSIKGFGFLGHLLFYLVF